MRNLKKKIEYFKELLGEDVGSQTESSGEDEDDEVQELQPKKKNINVQRKAVSAEVYGTYNKKENFVPPVVAKSEESKEKLQKRLLEAFMFAALDKKELSIVVDAISEVKGGPGEAIITEGDEGDCMYVLE
jgi:cAMP-dependent protein kinase regulator